MKNHLKKYWYFYAIGIVILLVVIKLLKDRNAPFKVGGSFGSSGNTGSNVSFTTDIDPNLVLRLGSQGSEVREMQIILNELAEEHGYSGRLDTDGVFGNLTLQALYGLTGQHEATLAEIGY